MTVFPVLIVGADGDGAVGDQGAVRIAGDQDGGQISRLRLAEYGEIPVIPVGGKDEEYRVVADRVDQGGEKAVPFHQNGRIVQAVQHHLQIFGGKGA